MSEVTMFVEMEFDEASRDTFLQELSNLSAASKKEDGCIFYEVFQQVKKPNIVYVFERWASKEAIQAHASSDHYQATADKIMPLLTKPMNMNPSKVL